MFMRLAAAAGRHAIDVEAGAGREGIVELQITLPRNDGAIGLEGLELCRVNIGNQAVRLFDWGHASTHSSFSRRRSPDIRFLERKLIMSADILSIRGWPCRQGAA
jgi:hypothetical protein